MINELSEKGANVIFQDAHVSGHACQEELKLIYSLVKPKYAVPIHGEYRHRKANASLAQSLGIPKENIFMLQSGDVLEVSDKEAKVVDKVHTGEVLVDGLGVGDVGNIVLRDRQHLAEDGILIVVMTLERGTNQLLAGPDIVSRGFVYVRESEGLMEDARKVLVEAVDTLGAGDSFATAFLLELLKGGTIEDAMQAGSEFAAKTCMVHGAFGHGISFEES